MVLQLDISHDSLQKRHFLCFIHKYCNRFVLKFQSQREHNGNKYNRKDELQNTETSKNLYNIWGYNLYKKRTINKANALTGTTQISEICLFD